MKDPLASFKFYMGDFQFLDKQFEEIEDVKEFLDDKTDKWGAAEGRSGGAARISLNYFKKAWEGGEERPRVGFYTDVGFEDSGTLMAVSGGGKTKEVLDAVKDGEFEKILVLTSKPENPLVDEAKKKVADPLIVVLPGREDDRGDITSHYEQQIVRGESETMGDLFEEKAMFFLYLVGKRLAGEKVSGRREVTRILENFNKCKEAYKKFERIMHDHWDKGIYFISKDQGTHACYMVANRAKHYTAKVFKSGDSTAPPMKNSYATVFISDGSADYSNLVEKIREKSTDYARSPIVGFGPSGMEWAKSCDHYFELEELFYAPIFINFALRAVANEKGITKTLAEKRHTDI